MSEWSVELRLGRSVEEVVEKRLRHWQQERFGERLWAKDHTLWSTEPVRELADRLGWLELPTSMAAEVDALERFAREAASDGIRHAVVLGMGGSSLAPEVYARTFGAADGYPALEVLDSTHPGAVQDMAARLDVSRSLFLVSSKSGTTTETLSFFRFFWERAGAAAETAEAGEAGRHFAAITDPGTPLETLARERGFRAVFNAPPDVGGRYSALTPFGLVPAALLGADLRGLLGSGRSMAEACGPRAAASPGLRLGAVLGELTGAGRDKVTFVTSPSLASFPAWLEQLIAESTGKGGKGIVPVAGEPLGEPGVYGDDRFFVALLLDGDDEGDIHERLAALEGAGHPVAVFRLARKTDLGAEMFRWEVAVAAAGAVLQLNPFDQPDVQLAKELAARAMKERGAAASAGGDEVAAEALGSHLEDWLAGAGPGSYLGIHAYLPPRPQTDESLSLLQARLRDRTRCATTLGHGPRFLHSTGQLHKGGPDSGRFLQIVDEPAEDLAVPETDYTFGTLIRAQADGDRAALHQRHRQVLRVQLGRNAQAGLDALLGAVERRRP